MIGGNCNGTLQEKRSKKSAIGEPIVSWVDVTELTGFLDFVSGDSGWKSPLNGALAETTHVFICDYAELPEATPCRMVISGKAFDVLSIDDPMGLHKHIEIMLKYSEVIRNG